MNAPVTPGMIINGKPVQEIPVYGCHSTKSPDRFKSDVVHHSKGGVMWPNRMSRQCRYDQKENDRRCDGCQHPWDQAYVDSIRVQKAAA